MNAPPEPDEEDDRLATLIERCAVGDERALEALYRVTAPRLFALALRLLRDEALAEVVLRDTFLSIRRRAPDLARESGTARLRLTALLRREALGRLCRRDGREPLDDLELAPLAAATAAPPSTGAPLADPLASLDARLPDARALLDALRPLSPETREWVVRAYREGRPDESLSAARVASSDTVETRVRDALVALEDAPPGVSDGQWWGTRAGEYVLGTLDAKGRELFERTLRHDDELRERVRAWERLFAPLDDDVVEREPPPGAWAAIGRHVPVIDDDADAADAEHDGRRGETPTDAGAASPLARRGVSLPAAIAVALSLAAVLLAALPPSRWRTPEAEPRPVAAGVILDRRGVALWLVQTDPGAGRVRVAALRPPPIEGEGDYQLWQVLPGEAGIAPVALLPDTDGATRDLKVSGLVEHFDAFVVSLEPDGGSPRATPSGEVLFRGEVFHAPEGIDTLDAAVGGG